MNVFWDTLYIELNFSGIKMDNGSDVNTVRRVYDNEMSLFLARKPDTYHGVCVEAEVPIPVGASRDRHATRDASSYARCVNNDSQFAVPSLETCCISEIMNLQGGHIKER